MNRVRPLLALLAACAVSSLHAESPADPVWRFGGFGTFGAGYHRSEGVQYRRDLEQESGYTGRKLGFRGDTRFGLQANARFDPRWSAMVQTVSRLRADGSWQPDLTWAFVRHSPADWLEVRVGRLGVDIYQNGDSRHVGYAYTTARPSIELYGLLTQDRFDGMDATVRRTVGTGVASFKLYGGGTRGDFNLYGAEFRTDNTRTLGATLEWASDALTLRAAWGDMYARDDESLQALAVALRQVPASVSPQAALRADRIDSAHRVNFAGVGALYEYGAFSLDAIAGWERFTGFPGFEGWAASVVAAFRVGRWKPYAGYGRIVFSPDDKPLSLPALNSGLVELQAAYDRVTDRLRMDQYTLTAGLRYDLATNHALKFQLDHTRAAASAMLVDLNGLPIRERSVTLYTLVLDFVF